MRRSPPSRTPAKTVKNIKSIWIKNAEGVVQKNKIVAYRVNAHITFEVQ